MAFEITIPRLGWSMEEGTFVRWLKQDGEFVKAGEAVYELEGEKAAQDIEAVDSGILRIPATGPKPGTTVAVGAVIGFLVAEGEAIPTSSVSNTPPAILPAATQATSIPKATVSMPNVTVSIPKVTVEEKSALTPAASPSVRRMAREMGVKLASVEGSGPAGKITAADLRTASDKSSPENGHSSSPENGRSSSPENGHSSTRIASPRARRVAGELGIDWRRLSGSGNGGRIRESDVRNAAQRPQGQTCGSQISVSSRRRTIASRMLASSQQTAPVTLTTRLDATNLVNLRNQFKQSANGGSIPSYSDIVMKLVGLALLQHPMLAARAEADHWVMPSSADAQHIGFAVDTDDGLVVPVIQGAGSLSLFEIAKRSSALIDKARTGKLSVAEMQGGVFTITNLGNFGIDAFTPIINVPETAVLGLGRIRKEAVVVENQIVARDQITLSLTFDHRIVDGAPAARFLQSVSQAIENPSAWLLRAEN